MTDVEHKHIPCALASSDHMRAAPRGDGRYFLVSNLTDEKMVTIALDRAGAKALKKRLKAFLKGGV